MLVAIKQILRTYWWKQNLVNLSEVVLFYNISRITYSADRAYFSRFGAHLTCIDVSEVLVRG